jgi:hypothetical protein
LQHNRQFYQIKNDYILKVCENIAFDNHNGRPYDMIFSNKFT